MIGSRIPETINRNTLIELQAETKQCRSHRVIAVTTGNDVCSCPHHMR